MQMAKMVIWKKMSGATKGQHMTNFANRPVKSEMAVW